MLNHCGCKMKNRFAILDVFEEYKDRNNVGVVAEANRMGARATSL